MLTPKKKPAASPPRPSSLAANEARAFGKFLTDLREDAGLSQADLAKRLEMDPSWVSRVEAGKITLKSVADVRTYAMAAEADADNAAKRYERIIEENFGVSLWGTRTVLPESFRREGESRVGRASSNAQSPTYEIADGIRLDVLKQILKHDGTAHIAARAWCQAFVRKNPTW